MLNRLKKHLIRQLTTLISVGLCAVGMARAEVVVLLPTTGALAHAAQSIQDGLNAAYYAANVRPTLRFVADDGQPLKSLLKRHISANTKLLIGPLDRQRVAELIKLNPSIPVLALNQVDSDAASVWEFALAPEEDAFALEMRIKAEGVNELLVLREAGQTNTQRFEQALNQRWRGIWVEQKQVPAQLLPHQALLLLGRPQWISQLKGVPKQRVYTTALAVDPSVVLPNQIQFCDVTALYQPLWSELVKEQQQKPVPVGYQRLVAFGADAWQLAMLMLAKAPSAEFMGRTGQLRLVGSQIERLPSCWIQQGQQLVQLP